MKKEKLFAPFLMLLAAAVAAIDMYLGHYEITEMLVVLFLVMLLFYVAGLLIQKKISGYMEQIRKKEEEEKEQEEKEKEGEVIEKGLSATEAQQEEEDK